MALEDLVNQKTITSEEGPYEQFEKCDVEPWKGLVPIYNIFVDTVSALLGKWGMNR